MSDTEEDAVEAVVNSDKDMLDRAVTILQKVVRGVSISSNCQCATCEAGKFLDEIVRS